MAVKTVVDRATASAKRAGSASFLVLCQGRGVGGQGQRGGKRVAGRRTVIDLEGGHVVDALVGCRDVSKGDSLCKVIPTEVMLI